MSACPRTFSASMFSPCISALHLLLMASWVKCSRGSGRASLLTGCTCSLLHGLRFSFPRPFPSPFLLLHPPATCPAVPHLCSEEAPLAGNPFHPATLQCCYSDEGSPESHHCESVPCRSESNTFLRRVVVSVLFLWSSPHPQVILFLTWISVGNILRIFSMWSHVIVFHRKEKN